MAAIGVLFLLIFTVFISGAPSKRGDFTPDPKSCVDYKTQLCENVPYYPEVKLKSILASEDDKYKYVFGEETLEQDEGISMRMGLTDTPLCPATTRIIYPKIGINKEGDKKFIVNLGGEKIQGLRIEVCKRNDDCTFAELFPSGYSTTCVQKHVYRRLLSVTDNGTTIFDDFKIPSCCSCSVSGPTL